MNDMPQNEELLLRYLDGELTAAEQQALEQQLQTDAALRQQLEGLRLAIQTVQQAGATAQVQRIHAEMMAELATQPTQRPALVRQLARRSLRVAASIIIVLLAAGGFYMYQLNPNTLYNQAFVAYDLSAARGGSNPTSVIEKEYQARNYKAVINDAKTTALSSQDSLLLALSYLQTNNTDAAIQWLHNIPATSTYRQDADYYLALAYLKNKAYDRALALMQTIHQSPGHLYHDQFSDAFIRKVKVLRWK